jgi:WD40 repeat protein
LFCIGQNGQFRSYFTSTWQLDTAFIAHSSTGTGISISPDGLWFATSGGQGKAILWSTNGYKPFHTLELPMLGTLNGVAIATDGKKVALASSLGYAAMFDIQNVPTSLKENLAFNNPVSLYPNPLTEVLKIEINHHTPVLIRISNQLGQIIWEQTLSSTQNIQTSDWQSGYYVVQSYVDGNIHLTKLVK